MAGDGVRRGLVDPVVVRGGVGLGWCRGGRGRVAGRFGLTSGCTTGAHWVGDGWVIVGRRGEAAVADGGDEAARVRLERAAAVGGQAVARHRLVGAKNFVDLDQAGGLEPAGVGGEVAVGQLRPAAEVHEFLALLDGERGQDLQPAGVGDERVEGHRPIYRPLRRGGLSLGRRHWR